MLIAASCVASVKLSLNLNLFVSGVCFGQSRGSNAVTLSSWRRQLLKLNKPRNLAEEHRSSLAAGRLRCRVSIGVSGDVQIRMHQPACCPFTVTARCTAGCSMLCSKPT
jgi:hypothetical protein